MGRRRSRQQALRDPRSRRAPASAPPAAWQALAIAVTLGIGLTSLVVAPRWAALLGIGAFISVFAFLAPWWRHRVRFAAFGAVLMAAASALAVWSHASHPAPAPAGRVLQRSMADLASAGEPGGFFPPRPALTCDQPATCGSGGTPTLDALSFGDGGFPQQLPDERRFLVARIVPDPQVHPTEDLRPGSDPLHVTPGQTIEIDGVIDNGARPGAAGAEARDARALIALPTGSGKLQDVIGSLSAINASPTAVSDSVTIVSAMPIYLRYQPGTALATREGITYRLSDDLVTAYDPDQLDRRQLAGHGARVGCHGPDGIVPAGRTCALRFHALFDVRYAATPLDANGIGGLTVAPFEVSGRIRGHDDVPLYWAPSSSAISDLTAHGGTEVSVDCVLAGPRSWYHLPDAAPEAHDPAHGFDTAFVPTRDVTLVHGFPSDCSS